MEIPPEISKEFFDDMLEEAIADLCRSGLEREEILKIIEEQFGLQYARKFEDTALPQKQIC